MGAHIPGGTFLGYRELPVVAGGKKPTLRPPSAAARPPRLSIIQLESLEVPTYRMAVFGREYAPDDWQDEYIMLPFTCRLLKLTLQEAPVEIDFSFDGVNPLPPRVVRFSFISLESISGFRIRNLFPHMRAWYQLAVFL